MMINSIIKLKISIFCISFALLIPITFVHAQGEDDNPPAIALSFDDAPNGQGFMFSGPERTDRILKSLKESNIQQVVFFCTTEKFDYHQGRERVEKYSQAGL